MWNGKFHGRGQGLNWAVEPKEKKRLHMIYVVTEKAYNIGAKNIYPCKRPWSPIGLWDVEVPTFSRQSAHRWRWVVSLTCRPPFIPRMIPGTISVRGWVHLRAIVRLEGLDQLKIQLPHRELNPRPSDLLHSVSINYSTACPHNIRNTDNYTFISSLWLLSSGGCWFLLQSSWHQFIKPYIYTSKILWFQITVNIPWISKT
jgi:hypothetical protein